MGVPGQMPPVGRGSGRTPGDGPFGDKAFRVTLVFCAVLVVGSPVALLLGGESLKPVATVLLVMGALGLVTGGAGLLAERRLVRRRSAAVPPPTTPPPQKAATPGTDLSRRNGHSPIRRTSRASVDLASARPDRIAPRRQGAALCA